MNWYEIIRKSDNGRIGVQTGMPKDTDFDKNLFDVYVYESERQPDSGIDAITGKPLYYGPDAGAVLLSNYTGTAQKQKDLETKVADLTARVATAESKVATLETKVTSLQVKVK